jgi:DNA-directed RNA polymerase specialized sigma subunit
MPRLVVPIKDIKDELEFHLERKPTKEEIKAFIGFLEVDIPQWLTDNAKNWVRRQQEQ